MRPSKVLALLLITAGTIQCQKKTISITKDTPELNKLEMTQDEKAQAKDFAELIKTNSPQSREEAALALENQVKALLKSEDPQAALMREFTYYTIKALRVGGDKLCSEADKIIVYRGNNVRSVWRTAAGKPFFAASYFQGGRKHLGHALRQYAQRKESASGMDPEDSVSPYDFDKISSRHTREVELSLSPFISTTHASSMASSFGDTTFTIKICPGRVPSTSEQAWAEQEMLAHLFVLPEEIEAETPESDVKSKVAPLGWCYAPEVGKGSRAHPKSVDAQTFKAWNQTIFNALFAERNSGSKADWAALHKTFIAQCDCANMVRKKNTLWLTWLAEGGPMYSQKEECLDYPNFKAQPILYVTKDQTMLKSGIASGRSCVVKRGVSFAFTMIEQESGHHKFITKESLPAGCEALENTPLYLSVEHGMVR